MYLLFVYFPCHHVTDKGTLRIISMSVCYFFIRRAFKGRHCLFVFASGQYSTIELHPYRVFAQHWKTAPHPGQGSALLQQPIALEWGAPIQLLTGPYVAWLQWSDGNWYLNMANKLRTLASELQVCQHRSKQEFSRYIVTFPPNALTLSLQLLPLLLLPALRPLFQKLRYHNPWIPNGLYRFFFLSLGSES